MNELKKLSRRLQTDAKSVLFTEENINDKLLKKLKRQDTKKTMFLLSYLIEM